MIMRMLSYLTYLIVILYLIEYNNSNEIPGPITVALIHDPPTVTDRLHTMGHEHAIKFLENVFNPNPIIERQIWPGVFTDNCMGVHFEDNTGFNKVHKQGFQRGLLLAHRQIWEDFSRKYHHIPENISFYSSPKLVIFEDDAMEIDPIVHNVAYESVRNMTKDLHVIGLCYDRDPGNTVPECNHAYALTVEGSRKLFANIDHCLHSGPLDTQFKVLGKEGLITWSSVPSVLPNNIPDTYIRNKTVEIGYTIEYGNQIGGFFYQVRFDNIIPCEEGQLYRSQWPYHHPLYLFRNGSLHRFPNLDTFVKMGYDFIDMPVTTLPYFQIQQLETDTLPVIRLRRQRKK